MKRKDTILVIAAHPDDEILGCGGAVARHSEQGEHVTMLILGEGIAARTGTKKAQAAQKQKKLYADAKKAATLVGAKDLILRAYPDNAFDGVPLLSIVHEIESVIRAVKPTLIYTHHAADVNIDHRVISAATEAAVRPMADSHVREVRAFEVASSSEWNFVRPAFRPNIFVALTEKQLEKKLKAMEAYGSEIRDFPHPRSRRYLEAMARVRGGQSGYKAAEGFELIYKKV